MLKTLKLGYAVPWDVVVQAQRLLSAHHATDPDSMQQWKQQQWLQTILNQNQQLLSMAQGKGGGKGKGPPIGTLPPGVPDGNWRQIGQKGRKFVLGAGGSGAIPTCGRCGFNTHIASQCPVRLNGETCAACGRSGHTEAMCRTKNKDKDNKGAKDDHDDDGPCPRCGLTDHNKRWCPWKRHTCEECGKVGHTVDVCRVAAAKRQRQVAPAPAAAAAASAAQQSKQPTKATPAIAVMRKEWGWTYLCSGCGEGVKDPDRTATQCPHQKCKAQLEPRTTECPTKTAWNMTLTKKSYETLDRLDKAGIDGILPLTAEQQKAHDRTEDLKEEIVNLKKIPGEQVKQMILERENEIKSLKKTLPVQASQQMRDQSILNGTLAEIEEKGEIEERRLNEKHEKLVEKKETIQADGKKDLDDLKEQMEKMMREMVENTKVRSEQADKDILAARTELEAFQVELAARKERIKTAPLFVASQAAQSPTTGAVKMDVAPGFLVHSNQVCPESVLAQLLSAPELQGIDPSQAATTTSVLLRIIQASSTHIAPPQQPSIKEGAQSVVPETSTKTTGSEEQAGAAPQQAQNEMEYTDGSTDEEDEAKAINEGKSRSKKKKRIVRQLPDAKHVAAKIKEKQNGKTANKDKDSEEL